METPEPDVAVDLASIAAIRQQLFRRWVPHYASLVVKLVPIAAFAGAGIHWLNRWLNPGASPLSPMVLPLVFGVTTFLICLWTLPAMLRLDYQINRRLKNMADRVASGETVYASEVRTSGNSGTSAAQSSLNTSLQRARER